MDLRRFFLTARMVYALVRSAPCRPKYGSAFRRRLVVGRPTEWGGSKRNSGLSPKGKVSTGFRPTIKIDCIAGHSFSCARQVRLTTPECDVTNCNDRSLLYGRTIVTSMDPARVSMAVSIGCLYLQTIRFGLGTCHQTLGSALAKSLVPAHLKMQSNGVVKPNASCQMTGSRAWRSIRILMRTLSRICTAPLSCFAQATSTRKRLVTGAAT